MNLIPWRRKREETRGLAAPEGALTQLRTDMDALFGRFFQDPWSLTGFEMPPAGLTTPRMDLADSPEDVTVTLELPGVRPEDVDVRIAGDVLTVRGEKREEKEETRRSVQFTERRYGSFQRCVQMPSTIDPNRVEANFQNGVLTIKVAKRADAQPKSIKIRNA